MGLDEDPGVLAEPYHGSLVAEAAGPEMGACEVREKVAVAEGEVSYEGMRAIPCRVLVSCTCLWYEFQTVKSPLGCHFPGCEVLRFLL